METSDRQKLMEDLETYKRKLVRVDQTIRTYELLSHKSRPLIHWKSFRKDLSWHYQKNLALKDLLKHYSGS